MPESLIEYPSDDTCLMYLLRHGATPHNLQSPPVMQGKGIDEPLAELGRRQAERACAALAERPIQAVYASPLNRATETAQAIAKPHGLEVEAASSLVEVAIGDWEGRSWADIEENDAERYRAFRIDPAVHGYPGGETLRELADRIIPCFAELMGRHVGEEIVVVAHSVVNRVYLGQLLGLSLAEGRKVQQQNCSISLVRWRDGIAKPVTINAVGHLM